MFKHAVVAKGSIDQHHVSKGITLRRISKQVGQSIPFMQVAISTNNGRFINKCESWELENSVFLQHAYSKSY